jgi:hypothetical protein
MTTLTLADICRVRYLLRAGFRHPQIARETGWSLWTISRIASDPRFVRTLPDDSDLEEGQPLVDDAPPEFAAGKLRRCGGCGATVYQWPCITCQARAERERFTAALKRRARNDVMPPPSPSGRGWPQAG